MSDKDVSMSLYAPFKFTVANQ